MSTRTRPSRCAHPPAISPLPSVHPFNTTNNSTSAPLSASELMIASSNVPAALRTGKMMLPNKPTSTP